MAKVNQITDLIGNTPLVRINKLNESEAEAKKAAEELLGDGHKA